MVNQILVCSVLLYVLSLASKPKCAPLCSESGVKFGLAAVHTLQFLKSKALHSKNVHLT